MEAASAGLEAPSKHIASAAPEKAAGQNPKWYLVYYLLAVLDVITVGASLTLNHKIMEIYVDSVANSQHWEKRETEYARLSELASAVNAPGNDVFDTRNVDAERERFRLALLAFEAQFSATRNELIGSVRTFEATLLFGAFDQIERAMREMTAEAELIFSYFEAGEAQRAGERMATMDRKYAGVLRAFAALFGSVRAIRQSHFDQQVRAAEWLRHVELAVMGLAILMIAGALCYGSRIYRGARAAEAERSQHIAALGRARAEADDANRAKSRFLAAVSHEVRTPLNSILLTLEMLEHPRSPEERSACIAVARSAGRSLKRLIDDLLDLSKIESGRIAFEHVRFEPRALVGELLAPYVNRAAVKGVPLHVHVAPEVPAAVEGDPTRFGQILANLVDNAIKFTATGSVEVSISLRPAPECDAHVVPLCVAVRDTGIGLAPEQRERIFEDFVQGDETTSSRYGGIGLGLGIVRRLVQMMKGEFGVLSTPGGGSTFWFELDLAASTGEAPAVPAPAVPCNWEKTLAGRHILLVEDAVASRMLTATVLEQMGMTVDLAGDGTEALDAVRDHRYDAVLMDIGLPTMSGFDAARCIRERERGQDEVPIIALTALVKDGVFEQCLDAGMDDYLAKPVTRESMAAALCRWIEPATDGGATKTT
jgi:signal transduction histidine kinase/ActR/RegA family two-component response regulator